MNVSLKPFRSYSEHDVINLFALDAASGDKGSLVTIKGSGFKNGEDLLFTSLNTLNTPNVVTQRPEVPWKVQLATSGDDANTVLGMILYDVREVNQWNYPLLFDVERRDAAQCVLSGQANPIVKRGMFLVSGMDGTPGPGSGAVVSDTVAGGWKVVAGGTAGSIGKFLGVKDADGYALFFLDL